MLFEEDLSTSGVTERAKGSLDGKDPGRMSALKSTAIVSQSGSSDDCGADCLAELLGRLRSGDQSAATEILERYEAQVRLVVRRCLPRVLRSRFDSQDIMQSVWRSFFQRISGEPVEDQHGIAESGVDATLEFKESSQLFAFLSRMARNKVIDQYRRETTQKTDIHRLRTIHGDSRADLDLADEAETASELLEAADELSHWRSLVPEGRQVLIDLKAEGHTSKEIGDKLGISERTVQRVLEDLRVRLERRRNDHDTFKFV